MPFARRLAIIGVMAHDPSHEEGSEPSGFVSYGLTAEAQAAVADAVRGAVATAGPDFGDATKSLIASVRNADPVTLMGAMAMYFGSADAGSNPEYERPMGMFQFHLELAQAMLIRGGQPGGERPSFECIPSVVDAVKRFHDAWLLLQARKLEQAVAGAERDLQSLLLQLRTRASALRGWGYQSQIQPMLRELLAPLDAAVQAAEGWRPGAMPAWWAGIADRINERLADHRAAVRDALEWPVDRCWAERIVERFGRPPGADLDAVTAQAGVDDDVRRGFVLHSSDLVAHEIFRFTVDELVELMPCSCDPEVVTRILASWSLELGADGEVAVSDLPLGNPVLERPFVRLAPDAWYLFCPWVLWHNPFAMIERLLDEHDSLLQAYMGRRAEFLELRAAELLRRALPDSTVERSLLSVDPGDGKTYENDVLALVSSYAVVCEAKAGGIPASVRRGRGRVLRERIDELLAKPSQQGVRLAEHVERATGTLRFVRKHDQTQLTVHADQIRRALTLSVTLEPIAGLLPRLIDIAEAGLSSRDADALSYNISLVDLELIVELLDHPSEFLHYIGRRQELERRHFLGGDEADLLGFYLQTGFNVGESEFSNKHLLDVTGLSDPIDRWHYRVEAGLSASKPRPARTSWWEAMLTRVEVRGGARWAEIGVAMCNVAVEDQRSFEGALTELRQAVRTGRRPPSDFVAFQNGPPQRRDHFIGVIAASADRAQREQQYLAAARSYFAKIHARHAILVAWMPVPIKEPYFALALFENE